MPFPFFDLMSTAPPPFDADRAAHVLADLAAACGRIEPDRADALRELLGDAAAVALLTGTFGNSPFLGRTALQDAAALPDLFTAAPVPVLDRIIGDLRSQLAAANDAESAMRALRIARRRVAMLSAFADLGGIWNLGAVTGALSRFAEEAIGGAVRYLMRQAVAAGDFETSDPDRPDAASGLTVLGMGKLGGRELNYSSDVDLIVLFDADTAPYVGRKTVQEAYIKLVRDLVRLLQEPTADGYVQRVDLRLRPDPGATPVAISMEAAEQYYESLGQNWERAAMIKARPVAGDYAAGEAFLERLTPFVWRRSLDFASIEDVHSIKRQIHRHRGHSEIAVAGHNIKLGRGGIRDIEFFVQTQQLIAGGRDPSLRDPTTLGAMRMLAGAGWIGESVVGELTRAYIFHRNLEHRLQMIADEQTQTMPKTPEGVDHVARFMGYGDTGEFETRLLSELTVVQKHYAALFEAGAELSAGGSLVFTGGEDDPETLKTLSDMGYEPAETVSATVRGWHHGRYRCTRTQRSREILTELMPALLSAIASTPNPNATLNRFDRFLAGLPAGIQLFSMLSAHSELLELIAEALGSAPRLADYLSRNAGVLDAVLSEDFFAPLPPREELAAGLAGGLRFARDYQDALDIVRRWVKDRRFQLGVQCLRAASDIDTQGRDQATVADTAIAGIYPAALDDFVVRERHGHIAGADMAVIGMGKLGSQEMTETSDLDLIFIYDYGEGSEQSDGERPLTPSHYFTRFSQRLINAITAQTPEGKMYDVDMRLRPSGNAGPVATRLQGFIDYQRSEAWTWEHMALTRARVISASPELLASIEAAIREVLCRPRDRQKLAADVAGMRRRIARDKPSRNPWELKLYDGGLLDIEFICQFLQLAHAAEAPEILHPNTCTALRNLADAGRLAPDQADDLIAASRLYRSLMGVLRVAIDGELDPDDAPLGVKGALARAAGEADFAALDRRVSATQAAVRRLFAGIVLAAAGEDAMAQAGQ